MADLNHPALRSLSGIENRRQPMMGLPIGPKALAIMLGILAVYGAVVVAIVNSLGPGVPV